ncbi:cell wall-binding repeat-containing protein [Curtobacterium sp. RRHDQ10]|uniref:cell wall-binding repeat-containing protein n=1 Tax=Curtobacterium phyllosphaerae TaxID=3413379 RepID=UPI003BF0F381
MRSRTLALAAAVATVATGLALPAAAHADVVAPAPTTHVHEIPSPFAAGGDNDEGISDMATGSDGLPWFITWGGAIGRVNADRTISTFTGSDTTLVGLVPGSDGALWSSDWGHSTAVRIAADGTSTSFPTGATAESIAAGRDGTMWFADDSRPQITRVTNAGVVTTFKYPVTGDANTGVFGEQGLVAGSDGALWFVPADQGFIGRFALDGTVSEYPLGAGATSQGLVLAGPDGGLWVPLADGGLVRVATDGTRTTFAGFGAGTSVTGGAVAGDGRLWFTEVREDGTSDIIAVSTSGTATRYPLPNSDTTFPSVLTAAQDGSLWLDQSTGDTDDFVTHVALDGTASTWVTGTDVYDFAATKGGMWFGEQDGSVGTTSTTDVGRVFGADRYATSVALAQQAYPTTAPVVFVATGANYPDALGAGPAAAALGGPLLLTDPGTLPASIAAEVSALAPKTVVIVGGLNAVSAAVAGQLQAAAPGATVTRINGDDRFDTSRKLADYAFGSATGAWIATATNFPDALSASAAAGSEAQPVVLVNGGSSTLDPATTAFLGHLGVRSATIVGGTNAVSAGIESGVRSAVGSDVTRIAGADRFDTSARIAAQAFPSGAKKAYVATGTAFPDALAGSALAAAQHAPLLTVRPECVPGGTATQLDALGNPGVTLIGGPNALSSTVGSLGLCSR